MPAPKSRKDSDGGWSKGSPSSKGSTGFKGKGTKANIDADADSESERPSASGTNVPGPPLDSDDDHDKQEADTTDKKEYEVDLEPVLAFVVGTVEKLLDKILELLVILFISGFGFLSGLYGFVVVCSSGE